MSNASRPALSIEETSALRAFAGVSMADACTYPHLPARLRAIADKLIALGLAANVNNIVRVTDAGRAAL